MDYLKNKRWDNIAQTTNDVELKETMVAGHGESEVLPHTKLDLLVSKTKKYKILDFGCGTGRNLKYLRDISTELHAYDLPSMIERCEELTPEKPDLLTGDWSVIQNNRYDMIVAIFTFQFIEDADYIRKFLEDMSKITSILYVITRCYIDSPQRENLAKIIQEDPNFEIVLEGCSIETFAKEVYPSDAHAEFICRSKADQRHVNQIIELNLKSPFYEFDPDYPFIYKSYAETVKDIKRWSDSIPEISAVVGIPRSGSFIAAIISEYRNIPLFTMDGILNDGICWRPSISRPINRPNGPVFVVDDTCWSGSSLKRTKAYLKNKGDYIYGSLYIKDDRQNDVDYFYGILPTVYHTFEWSLLRDPQCGSYICDLDGVFCPDHDKSTIKDGSKEYIEHLKTVNPSRYTPQFPVMKICTARLEKYRSITEDWLSVHKIRYKELIMSPYNSEEERLEKEGFGKWKAEHYLGTPEASLFVESEHSQAIDIYNMTQRPVFCMDTMTLYGGLTIDVSD